MRVELTLVFESSDLEHAQPLQGVAENLYQLLIKKAIEDNLQLVVENQSIDDLGNQLEYCPSHRTMLRIISKLVNTRYLCRERRRKGYKGQEQTNIYFLKAKIEKMNIV